MEDFDISSKLDRIKTDTGILEKGRMEVYLEILHKHC